MKEYRIRINKVEFRAITRRNADNTATILHFEIIEWHHEDETCHTLANYTKDDEGFNLMFIGGRPFIGSRKDFWKVAKMAQKYLDKHFRKKGY